MLFSYLLKDMKIIFFIFLFFFNSTSSSATLKVKSNFGLNSLKNVECAGNCPSTKKSSSSGKFVLTRDMSVPYRTEIILKKNGSFDFEKEYWMGLSYRYEDWKKDSSQESAPFQIHSKPANWYPYKGKTAKECGHGSAWGQAPFFMASANGETKFITYGGRVLWTKAIQTKKWINIVVHFRLSDTSNGVIEVWQDGVHLGRKNGANVFLKDDCNNPMVSPYLKIGIYKWDWKKGRAKTNSTRRQILIDNIKIAEGSDGFHLVGSTHKPKKITSEITKKH